MVEYGGAVSQGSGAGGGGGPVDLGGNLMGALSDVLRQIAALPPEMLLMLFAVIAVGGLFAFRRA